MRLANRRLALLLTCSFLITSSRVQAGNFMDQPFADRVLFMTYVLKVCSIALSSSLQNFVLGEATVPTQNELNQVTQLWTEQQGGFAAYQAEHPTLTLTPSFGPQLLAWPDQLQAIAQIAPALAEAIDRSFYSEVHLPVSGTMLKLLLRLVKHENIHGDINALGQSERESLRREANRLNCEKILQMLPGSPRSNPVSSVITMKSSKKTNDNGSTDNSNVPEIQPIPVKERRQSQNRLSYLRKISKSHEKKETTKEQPNETVSLGVDLAANNATPLEILRNFSETKRDNSLICHYYPMVASDDDLAGFLKLLDFKKLKNFNFALELVKCFAEQGFPNGTPSIALRDTMRLILQDSIGTTLSAEFENKLVVSQENSLSHLSVTIEDLNRIFTDYKDNAVVAIAWTQSHLNLFRNLKPADLNLRDRQNSIALVISAFHNEVMWLSNLVKSQTSEKEKFALLKRLVKISQSMLQVGNFHGAYIIHHILLDSAAYPELRKFDKETVVELMNTFAIKGEFKCCRDKITELRSSESKTFLSPMFVYTGDFDRKMTLAETMNPSDRIMEIGTFLQQVHKDKSHAPKIENVNLELLNLFMNLAYLKVTT